MKVDSTDNSQKRQLTKIKVRKLRKIVDAGHLVPAHIFSHFSYLPKPDRARTRPLCSNTEELILASGIRVALANGPPSCTEGRKIP